MPERDLLSGWVAYRHAVTTGVNQRLLMQNEYLIAQTACCERACPSDCGVPLAIQNSIDGILMISADLAHPQTIRRRRDSGDFDPSCRKVDKESTRNRCSPRRVHTSTAMKSAATINSQCLRLRSGAGTMPCRSRISAIVLRAIWRPRLD